MNIAIIGSGISGLFAAWRLSREHQVTLFEAAEWLGGHVNTVSVEVAGRTCQVDTGFIVYNEQTYPLFSQLLAELGVATQPTSMSFSVRCDRGGMEYSGKSLRSLFAQPRNVCRPAFWTMLADILRFNRMSKAMADAPPSAPETATVGEFLREHRFSPGFVNWYLLPMGAAIWSCTQTEFRQFPLSFLLTFFRNHGLLEIVNRPVWRVIQGGSRTYVDQLLARCGPHLQLRLRTPVNAVRRTAESAVVSSRQGEDAFDHVVFACHSDQALRLLQDPSPLEAETLAGFRYGKNIALLHTDISVLPRSRSAWSSWNYFIPADQEPRPRVTYNMNILQGLDAPVTLNVSLNSEEFIDPALVLKRIEYWHPLFDSRTRELQQRHSRMINVSRTSYCGAYWRNGFHEDGLVSALAVCDRLCPSQANSASFVPAV